MEDNEDQDTEDQEDEIIAMSSPARKPRKTTTGSKATAHKAATPKKGGTRGVAKKTTKGRKRAAEDGDDDE